MRANLTCLLSILILGIPAPLAAEESERAALYIDTLRQTGCTMTEELGQAILPGLGFDQDEVQKLRKVLYQTRLLYISFNFDRALLDPALCAAAPEDDAATFDAARNALEWSGGPEMTVLFDVASLRSQDPGYFPAMVMAYAGDTGCSIDVTDRDAAVQDILTYLLDIWRSSFVSDVILQADAAPELAAIIAAELDTPADWFAVEPGRLVLEGCSN